ncbi:MAG: S8 family serine peptidase [Pyrinomonadaceae bacterium]
MPTKNKNQSKKENKENGEDAGFTLDDANGNGSVGAAAGGGEFTGRYLVLLEDGKTSNAVKSLEDDAGLSVATSSDYKDDSAWTGFLSDDSQALVFEELGVAVVEAPPDQINAIGASIASEGSSIATYEPERYVYAFQDFAVQRAVEMGGASAIDLDYIQGYRDAVNELASKILGESGSSAAEGASEPMEVFNEGQFTWGLQATKAAQSSFTGRGVRVAVLDTGMDLQHPDFIGRTVKSQSFVPGQAVQDGHGHGTHCIGTSCGSRGPRNPNQLPRYGVAYEAEIYAGKVLSNSGGGSDGGILNGINWAVANRCAIVSMSLGARVSSPNQPFSAIYEQAAQRALLAGTLIIAAAGNDSNRPSVIWAVSHPANCPSIMAVGAIDAQLGTNLPKKVASFSNAGLNPQGGQVDIAGPGRAIRSSWLRPQLYNTISGTSMATPHVAGIAALFAQAFPTQRGRALAGLLLSRALRLPLPSRDVGAGMVQAP